MDDTAGTTPKTLNSKPQRTLGQRTTPVANPNGVLHLSLLKPWGLVLRDGLAPRGCALLDFTVEPLRDTKQRSLQNSHVKFAIDWLYTLFLVT